MKKLLLSAALCGALAMFALPAAADNPTALYLVGNFNGWTTPATDNSNAIELPMTADGIYSADINTGTIGTLEFKIFDAYSTDWANSHGPQVMQQ